MGGVDRLTDLGGHTLAGQGKMKDGTMTDATAIVGAEIDRHSLPGDSCLVIATVKFTSASGATGGKNTLLLELYDDTVTGMGTEALFDSDTYEYTWAANGANDGVHVLPVNLIGANRFIRAKATLTEAGTITISAQTGSLSVVLGGPAEKPYSGYAVAGYENATNAA